MERLPITRRELAEAVAFSIAGIVGGMIVSAIAMWIAISHAHARDLGQWENSDPAIVAWYKTLKQPDYPDSSCCGEGDAYWTDSFEVDADGNYVAIITDTRPDDPLKRAHIPVGTKIVVPKNKIKWDQGNPTGHGVIFVGAVGDPGDGNTGWFVWCYCPPIMS